MGQHTKYFNFPICLLENFMNDTRKCLNNISDYAVYYHSKKQYAETELTAIKDSASYFRIILGNNLTTLKNGKALFNSIDLQTPKTGINKDIWFDFYLNDKTEFEKICLLAHLALKSIVQNKPYAKLDNQYWLSRMAGFSKSKAFELLPPELIKYANEYQTKKIKNELRNNWGLKTYSRYTRGFYVSYKLTLEQLVLQAEKKRKSTKDKNYKKKESEALKKALEILLNE